MLAYVVHCRTTYIVKKEELDRIHIEREGVYLGGESKKKVRDLFFHKNYQAQMMPVYCI